MKDCESTHSIVSAFPIFNERQVQQLNPGIERRLSLSLLSYWEKKRVMRDMPEVGDINKDDLSPYWGDCFLLALTTAEDGYFTMLHRGGNIHEDWPPNSADLEASVATVVANRRPVLDEGQMQAADGQVLKYRQCLLPIGESGAVKLVLGGIRFRAF